MQHEKALRLYLHHLRDFAGAEKYCDDVYHRCRSIAHTHSVPLLYSCTARSGDEDCTQVYMALLKACTCTDDAPSSHVPSDAGSVSSDEDASDEQSSAALNVEALEKVMRILAQRPGCIESSQVLKLLPPNVPVSIIQPFILTVLRLQNSQIHAARLRRQVYGLNYHTAAQAYLQARYKAIHSSISITKKNQLSCSACNKPLGKPWLHGADVCKTDRSASGPYDIKRLPDGRLLHIQCQLSAE